MDLGLKDKVAIITGAGSEFGYGKAIALTLAKEGCNIIAVDADLKAAEQTASEVKATGRKTIALKADVTSKADVYDMVKKALAEFGKIDILINNIGITSPMQPFLDSSENDWDLDMKVNYKGTVLCTKAVLPQMMKQKSGRIINISSPGASHGNDPYTTYTASKAAVLGFSKALAAEVGPSGTAALVMSQSTGALRDSGVNINVIATQQTKDNKPTPPQPMSPGVSPSSPKDVGNVAAFLASEGAKRVSGVVINV
jgi:NAD(P)-dependent dehydrogenase (short-subunit alcohol dehydrogenase family)